MNFPYTLYAAIAIPIAYNSLPKKFNRFYAIATLVTTAALSQLKSFSRLIDEFDIFNVLKNVSNENAKQFTKLTSSTIIKPSV